MGIIFKLLLISIIGVWLREGEGQFLPVGSEILPFVLLKYRLDECIDIAKQFYQTLPAGGSDAVMRWVVPHSVNDVTVYVGCPACGTGGTVTLRVYRGNAPTVRSGNVRDSVSLQLFNVREKEVVFIQLTNTGSTNIAGINIYIIGDIHLIQDDVTATRSRYSEVPRFDFNIPFQLPPGLYIPPGGAVIVRFDGDRRLADNYIRYEQPVEYDMPDGPYNRDKFDIWAQHYKTYGDELVICPPKFQRPYYVSARTYWENTIVNYKIYYGILYPFEKLQ